MAELKTLAELNKANLERAKVDRHLAFTTYPELLYPILLRPCTVRILMVTDGGGSFTDGDFGLTELLNVLSVSPGPYVRFAVTKAHRSATGGNGADIDNFRFDTTDVSGYDQIWMIGVSRTGMSPLSDGELKAVSQFMDSGGGVFATGDHEDLGNAMCGRVPRVRSMRKWHWPAPGPNGEPVAPGGSDTTRLDTNQTGHDANITFDDQSDDVPQGIQPVMHSVATPVFFRRIVYPHPLLCGPRGVIRVLPDHPHEGECYVPSDLTKTFTFAGYTITEYPVLTGSTRLAPEIVSRSNSGAGISGKSVGASRSFGANAAFDGHRVGVGRVAVESTWHHIFNINLKGAPGNADPVKQQGFYASTAGLDKYEDIKAYFRNIAVWLARPASQACMRWRLIWAVRWDSRIFMDLRPFREIAAINFNELIRVGHVARDVLNRYAPQCQSHIWILDWLVKEKIRIPIDLLRPKPPLPDPPPDVDPLVFYYSHAAMEASLGAMVYSLALKYPEATDASRKAGEKIDEEMMSDAAKAASEMAVKAARESLKQLELLVK